MGRGGIAIPDQRDLWNVQHGTRGVSLEGGDLAFTPNKSAVEFADKLKPGSTILEVGCANGRDARYWATLGHKVLAMDFSEIALKQLQSLAAQQGVGDRVTPILWDAATGCLPPSEMPERVDAFYARSSLHVNDTTLYDLAFAIDRRIAEGGVLFIEGKGPNDEKIARSEYVGRNMVVDQFEGGHLRRVWTCAFARRLCGTMKWDILELADNRETWNGTTATFMRLLARKGGIL